MKKKIKTDKVKNINEYKKEKKNKYKKRKNRKVKKVILRFGLIIVCFLIIIININIFIELVEELQYFFQHLQVEQQDVYHINEHH